MQKRKEATRCQHIAPQSDPTGLGLGILAPALELPKGVDFSQIAALFSRNLPLKHGQGQHQ